MVGRTSSPSLGRLPLGIVTALVAIALIPADAHAAKPRATCDGHRATIVGTNGEDSIRGTRKRDVIQARGGDDLVRGLGGNDLICSGSGRDQVLGGPGQDAIHLSRMSVGDGGSGDDRIWTRAGFAMGGPGNDTLRGGAGTDILFGESGDDTYIDASGDNQVSDSRGRTVVRLGDGDDFVETAGYTTATTGGGDDRVFASGAIATGSGVDYVQYKVCTSCRSADRFAVSLGPDDDAMTIGDGVASPVVGSPVAATIDFTLNGGTGTDSLDDWFAVGAAETTTVVLGPAGSVAGPWSASQLIDFENYFASEESTGPRSFHVTGSEGPNNIWVFGPDSYIYGLGGDDTLGKISTAGHIDGGDGTDTCDSRVNQNNCEVD